MKKILSFIVACAIAIPSVGCLEAHSLDQYGYVMGIGFDKGEVLPYRITLMLQNMQMGSDEQKNGGFTLIDAECRNLFEAIETLSGSLPFQLDFARTALLVIESSLLQEEGGLERLLDLSLHHLLIRYNANVFVSLSSAYDAMGGLQNELDPNLSKMQQNFVAYSESTGLIPVTNLMMLSEEMTEKTHDPMLPVCGITHEEQKVTQGRDSVGETPYAYIGGSLLIKSGMKTELAGAALLSNGRMVGVLGGQNTQLLLMGNGTFQSGRMQLLDRKGNTVSVYFEKDGEMKVHLTLWPMPRAIVTIPLTANIELPDRSIEESKERTQEMIAEQLAQGTQKVFACCQKHGADTFGFGKYAVKQFSRTVDWDRYDWKKAYQELNATFIYTVRLVQNPEKSALE
ncbi:MAG: Ger(x)C family spore germination C-terminal domain-containing protein [Clostridia bacterium]